MPRVGRSSNSTTRHRIGTSLCSLMVSRCSNSNECLFIACSFTQCLGQGFLLPDRRTGTSYTHIARTSCRGPRYRDKTSMSRAKSSARSRLVKWTSQSVGYFVADTRKPSVQQQRNQSGIFQSAIGRLSTQPFRRRFAGVPTSQQHSQEYSSEKLDSGLRPEVRTRTVYVTQGVGA